jgi:hypothetical protein
MSVAIGYPTGVSNLNESVSFGVGNIYSYGLYTILGSKNKVAYNNNSICGSKNIVYGKNNNVVGNNNIIFGDNNNITGNNNIIYSTDNNIVGSNIKKYKFYKKIDKFVCEDIFNLIMKYVDHEELFFTECVNNRQITEKIIRNR